MNLKKLVLKIEHVIISMIELNSNILSMIVFYWMKNQMKIF